MKFVLLLFVAVAGGTEDFLSANKQFSASLYKKVAKNSNGNVLVSPFSLQTVLGLTQSGCRGETAEEIRSVLHLQKVEDSFGSLLPSISKSRYYTFHAANKIYLNENFEIKNEFKEVARRVFQADCEPIDFGSSEAAQIINTWVEKQTFNKIKNLVTPSSLNSRTRSALINSIYFKANWSKPFPVAYTKKKDFYVSQSEVVPADTMVVLSKNFNYSESRALKAKFLEVPFQEGEASMVLVLPNEPEGLPLLEKQMGKVLKYRNFSTHSINLYLPRFRVETSLNLKKVLKNMGVGKIFDERSADLSGIAGRKGELVVDKVAQKTFLDVSEEGVEGAAATYFLLVVPLMAPSEPPRNFTVDRPFLFYIKVRDVVVFVGRVTDPTKH